MRADPLFHVAEAAEWEAARASGRYERSTRGLSLAEVGFIHLATSNQWSGVLDRFYADHEGDLLLLRIDPARLTAPLRWEAVETATAETFPHLYGALDVEAVIESAPVPGRPSPG